MFMKRIGQLLEAVIRLHGDGIIHRSVNVIACNRTCVCNLIKVLSPIATIIHFYLNKSWFSSIHVTSETSSHPMFTSEMMTV